MKNEKQKSLVAGNKFYSLYEMVKLKVFPWINPATYERYKSVLITDAMTNNILKASKVEGPRGIQYKIRGQNIIKYVTKKEDKSI